MKCLKCGSRKIEKAPIVMGEDRIYIEHFCKKCEGVWIVNEKGNVIIDNFKDKTEFKRR